MYIIIIIMTIKVTEMKDKRLNSLSNNWLDCQKVFVRTSFPIPDTV